MNDRKHFQLLYRQYLADIYVNGIITYKLRYKKKLVLTDHNDEAIAEIKMNFLPFFLKNIIKVHYLKENQIILVDKNFLGTQFNIKFNNGETLKIATINKNDYVIRNQIIPGIERVGGMFSKFCFKIDFDYEDNLEAQIIFITFFYDMRHVFRP